MKYIVIEYYSEYQGMLELFRQKVTRCENPQQVGEVLTDIANDRGLDIEREQDELQKWVSIYPIPIVVGVEDFLPKQKESKR